LDLFRNRLSKEKYAATNEIWNQLGLNKAWRVGYVTDLIKQRRFATKEEWKAYYFQSGIERHKKMSKLLASEYGKLINKTPSKNLELNKINYGYGRTEDEVKQIGRELYRGICDSDNPLALTENECMYAAYFRIICETWNGVVVRESETKAVLIEKLEKEGYSVLLIDTLGSFDYEYAVDFEVYWDGRIICGLQIKPESYRSNKAYIEKAHKINVKKNEEYTKKYGRLVFYVYSNSKGEISNSDVISQIIEEIECVGKLGLGYKK